MEKIQTIFNNLDKMAKTQDEIVDLLSNLSSDSALIILMDLMTMYAIKNDVFNESFIDTYYKTAQAQIDSGLYK